MLEVHFVNEGEDLFWLDTSEEEKKVLKCMQSKSLVKVLFVC